MKRIKKKNFDKKIIFCDFDGTITLEDTVDKFLLLYANDQWLKIEDQWEKGLIGSRVCLEQQINCIGKISEREIKKFAAEIEIDPHFMEFLKEVKKNKIDFYIVSDGFDILINQILSNYKIKDVPVFSNKLELKDNKLYASFPYQKNECYLQSGMCKCAVIENKYQNKHRIYIGDGKSDMCAVNLAEEVYAKKRLANYCRDNKISYTHFAYFNDITNSLFKEENKYATVQD